MPESKGRKKTANRRYELHPHRKQRTKSSPSGSRRRWPLMIAGIGIIVWNFFRNDGNAFNPGVMWLGLGVLAAGFFGISLLEVAAPPPPAVDNLGDT
jgi:hypothetical protein